MNWKFRKAAFTLSFILLLVSGAAVWAAPQNVRWTGQDDPNAEFDHLLTVLGQKTGTTYSRQDFMLIEDRNLSRYHFQFWIQLAAGVPIRGNVLRIWQDRETHSAVQVEALVENPARNLLLQEQILAQGFSIRDLQDELDSQQTIELAKTRIKQNSDDTLMANVTWRDYWQQGDLVRVLRAKGRRGNHQVMVSLTSKRVVSYEYSPFPQADALEAMVSAQVYPIYEEVESTGHIQPRIPATLKYLKPAVARPQSDPYSVMQNGHYTDDKQDPILGETSWGQSQGYWSMNQIKTEATRIRDALPVTSNDFLSGLGVILDGRYATVSLHPTAVSTFKGLQFTPTISAQFKPDWIPTSVDNQYEMVPKGSFLGRPLADPSDAWNRPARRLPDHDPVSYINDGFDEIQVYWSINMLFESLRKGGFDDPELSTRPFNAFLYDPDISMRDNAYYTDDTINFTTYSPKAINYARDNSTIWHELGHGVMDRMMGDAIQLADTGGLSEGMADFIAALVIEDVSEGKPFEGSENFRIINQTGFFLTNEVHDDGEAYGGAMHDLLKAVIDRDGHSGLQKVVDLTMDTMRLTRNHPGLTAQDWFNHMLFADSLGRSGVRKPHELESLVRAALAGRNFSLEGEAPAQFTVKYGDMEITSKSPGSRNSPIRVSLAADELAHYPLLVSVKSTDHYPLPYPLQVRVVFKTGPLQGAIHWEGEESSPLIYTLQSEQETFPINLSIQGKCKEVNRDDGSCVDYASIQILKPGDLKPRAKKRFYLRLKTH